MGANYAPDEERSVREALRAGGAPLCPRCGGGFEAHAVPPRGEVSYVRDRIWLFCAACRRSVLLDRREVDGS